MSTKSFGQDVVVAVIFGEDRHAVRALNVADFWCIVDVVHCVRDVVAVNQSVTVCYFKGEDHVTKLVGERRDGYILAVLSPINEHIVVSDKCSFGNIPCQGGFLILNVIGEVGQTEGERT